MLTLFIPKWTALQIVYRSLYSKAIFISSLVIPMAWLHSSGHDLPLIKVQIIGSIMFFSGYVMYACLCPEIIREFGCKCKYETYVYGIKNHFDFHDFVYLHLNSKCFQRWLSMQADYIKESIATGEQPHSADSEVLISRQSGIIFNYSNILFPFWRIMVFFFLINSVVLIFFPYLKALQVLFLTGG